jgi:hypothetical protein
MRIGLATLVVALGTLSSLPALSAQNCPAGFFMIMDNMGKYRCEPINDRQAAARAMNGGCPGGSHPWTDFWGNNVCRSSGGEPGIGQHQQGIQGGSTPGPYRTPGPPGFASGRD